MDKQLLDIFRTIIREDVHAVVHTELQSALKVINSRLDKLEVEVIQGKTTAQASLRKMVISLKEQDDKLDAILEAWQIQRVHREELDEHEKRIQTIEHRIPALS